MSSERDEFVRYLLSKGNICADECTVGGGMGGAFRPVNWFVEHWKDFSDRSSIDARWLSGKMNEFGFEARAQNYQKKMVRGFKISAALLSACGGVGDRLERTREIDGEQLSPAEQRRFRAKLQANTDRVSAALREVKAQVFVGITEPLLCAPTAEILALQRAVNELVASATQVA